MFKTFIPPQTDGMICSSFNIGFSESKVIFNWRENNKKNNKKTNKKALQTPTRSKLSHLVYFTNKHSRHGQSTHRNARLEPAMRNAQKLADGWQPPHKKQQEGLDLLHLESASLSTTIILRLKLRLWLWLWLKYKYKQWIVRIRSQEHQHQMYSLHLQ